jgi:Secretion system C-terminal sorting domain
MKQLKTTVLITLMLCMHATLSYSQPDSPPPACYCNLGTCSGSLVNMNYSNSSIWTPVLNTPNSMGMGWADMRYYQTPGATYNRMLTDISSITPYSHNFITECKLTVTGGSSPGHYVIAITEKDQDPVSSISGSGYPLTNNDALAVVLKKEGSEPTSTNCCENPCATTNRWLLHILAKDGATSPVFSTGIPIGCQLPVTYYVRLVRYQCWTYLGVYSNPGFTTHIAGSPVCMTISQNITGLRKLQHGVITWSSNYRRVSMAVDDTRICPYTTGCTPTGCGLTDPGDDQTKQIPLDNDISKDHYISITPNPSSGFFKLNINNADEKITSIAIYDLTGKIYKLIDKVENTKGLLINGNELKNGMYMVEAYGKTKTWKSKIVIQR